MYSKKYIPLIEHSHRLRHSASYKKQFLVFKTGLMYISKCLLEKYLMSSLLTPNMPYCVILSGNTHQTTRNSIFGTVNPISSD